LVFLSLLAFLEHGEVEGWRAKVVSVK